MKKKSTLLLLLSTLLVAVSPNKSEIFKNIEEKHTLSKMIKNLDQNKTVLTSSTINMTMGNVKEGERIFIKYFQRNCEQSAISFAATHSQDEWEAIVQAGEFKSEILKLCPNIKKNYKKTWSPNLYQFVYEYANDTGDIPSF